MNKNAEYPHLLYTTLPQIFNVLLHQHDIATIATIRRVSKQTNQIYTTQTALKNHIHLLKKIFLSLADTEAKPQLLIPVKYKIYKFTFTLKDDSYYSFHEKTYRLFRLYIVHLPSNELKGFIYRDYLDILHTLAPLHQPLRRKLNLNTTETITCVDPYDMSGIEIPLGTLQKDGKIIRLRQ